MCCGDKCSLETRNGSEYSPDLLDSLNIFSELGVEIGRGHLSDFLVLEVRSSVNEPGWDSVGDWVGDHISDLGDLFLSQFSGSLVKRDSGLVAHNDGESSSNTSDFSKGEW